MARPQRNLLLVIASIGALVGGASVVDSPTVILGAGVVALAVFVAAVFAGRDFFVGRFRMRQRRWDEALAAFEAFESKQLSSRLRRALAPLFVGIYSYDGVAIALNNQAVVRLNQGKFPQAEELLRRALSRDAPYAIPHVNLAILFALMGNAAEASREHELAQSLGFRGAGLQQRIRTLLARTNTAVGAAASSEPTR